MLMTFKVLKRYSSFRVFANVPRFPSYLSHYTYGYAPCCVMWNFISRYAYVILPAPLCVCACVCVRASIRLSVCLSECVLAGMYASMPMSSDAHDR